MKLLTLLFIWLAVATTATAQRPVWVPEPTPRPQVKAASQQTPHYEFILRDGTPVKLKLKRELSSATEQVGATVDFEVLEPVVLDEKVVIQAGAIALGTVTEAVPKRRMGRTGKLEVRIDSVTLLDGQRIPLRAVNTGADGSRVGTVTTTATVVGMVFFPAAPLALLMKGKDITIPNGTFTTAYVNNDHKLDADRFTMPAEKPVATVHFKAEKPEFENAEIWIEAKFMGNAPATIKLPEGEYEIVVQKSGYLRWRRTIAATAGSLMNLTFSLQKQP